MFPLCVVPVTGSCQVGGECLAVEPHGFSTGNSKVLTPAFHPRPNVPHLVNLMDDVPSVPPTPTGPRGAPARPLVRERTLSTDRAWTAQIIARRLVRRHSLCCYGWLCHSDCFLRHECFLTDEFVLRSGHAHCVVMGGCVILTVS